jgi:hypothetical protein
MPKSPQHFQEYLNGLIAEAKRRGIPLPSNVERRISAPVGSVAPSGESLDALPFREWCEALGRSGLTIDGHPFRLDNRRALWAIYDCIPSDVESAFGRTVVLQKSAQMGATVLAMLAALYLAVRFPPCKILYYLPDRGMAGDLSATRFMPILRTIPRLHELVTGGGKDEGNTLTRIMPGIGSIFRFLWTSAQPGGVTESYPGDALFLDEVQGMSLEEVDRVYERLSASRMRWRFLLSTPLFPDLDVNAFYLLGNQNKFHSACGCGAGVVLTDLFFEAFFTGKSDYPVRVSDGEHRYYCPHCDRDVLDPQVGDWLPHNPHGIWDSFHISQILSPTISPRELLLAARNADTADRRQNFSCRKLGQPFVDASQLLATLPVLRACAEDGDRAGVVWKLSGKGLYMGLDQMGSYIVATVAMRMPDGRMAVVHVEAIQALDPWARCDELMDVFGVVVCVVEQLPNIDSARGFAHRHPGRVWLITSYGDLEEFCAWGDVTVTKSDRKLDADFRDRYTLRADRYRVLDWAAARFRERFILFPSPDSLVAEWRDDKGAKKRGPILSDMFWDHYTRTGLVLSSKEDAAKGGKGETGHQVSTAKREVLKLGLDPHASFSLLCVCLAWFRAHGTTSFVLPGVRMPSDARAIVEKNMPGLPAQVLDAIDSRTGLGTCGGCEAYQEVVPGLGTCRERGFQITPKDPACELFVGV